MEKAIVALFIRGFHNGGIEKVFEMYYSHMDLSPFEIHIITYLKNDPNRRDFFEKLGCIIHEVSPIKGSKINRKNIQDYRELFAKYKFDVVHNNIPEILLPVIFAKIYKVPILITHSHSVYTRRLKGVKSGVYKKIFNLAARMSTLVIGVSTDSIEAVFGHINRKAIVLPNAIEIEKYVFDSSKRKEIRFEGGFEDKIVLGHVGRFDGNLKNHDLIISVFESLVKIDSRFRLILVGDGRYRKTCEMVAAEKGIKDKILFTGVVYDVQNYLMAMDIFLFPSKQEGLGIAAIEAQATGLPCLISDQVPHQVQVTDNVKFLQINGESAIKQWVENILLTAKNLSEKKRKSYAAQVGLAGYDINIHADKLKSIYLGARNI